jgi:uncharacterized protein YaaR (DUF327 family)
MRNIKKFEAFSDEIHIHPTLSNFNKEDMQDFYDEFQIIADIYNLTEVKFIDPDNEINQYNIGVLRNAFIELVLFKDSDEIIDELKSFIEKVKQFGWRIINKINIENYGEYKEVTIVFTKRSLTESIDNESDIEKWESIQAQYDVYQLYDLLVYKYGPIFIDTKQNIDEDEGDYNPDYIYDVIELELKSKKLWEDFINNYEIYQNDKDEADPFHWKYRKKMQDDFTKNFKSSLESMKYIKRINEHIIDYDSKNIRDFYNDLISELKNTQRIPFDKVQEIGNKNDIEVVDYKGFKDEISEDMKKGAPPSTTPLFGLVNPKTKKIRLVITVPAIGRPFVEMAYHMIKHENIHIGQYARKNTSMDSEFLGDVRDLKKYFSNKDEVMAFSQSISDMIMGRGPKNLKDAIQRIKNNELYNDIKKHVDEEILKRYQKYIFLYLEKEFENETSKNI